MITIYRERAIAIIEIHGTPTIEDIKETIDALLKHPDHLDGMDEIWDFRQAAMASFTAEDLRTLALFVKQHLDRLARRRWTHSSTPSMLPTTPSTA